MENEALKKNQNILWLKDKKNNVVDFATIVDLKKDSINIEWYEGAELNKKKISQEDVLAIEDKKAGLEIEIGGYSGKGHLTHHGYEYVGKQDKRKSNIKKTTS